MSDNVQFGEEDNTISIAQPYMSRRVIGEPVEPPMIHFVRKMGIVKTDAQAYYVLVGIGILCFVLTCGIFAYFILGVGHKQQIRISVPKDIKAKLPLDVQQKINATYKKN